MSDTTDDEPHVGDPRLSSYADLVIEREAALLREARTRGVVDGLCESIVTMAKHIAAIAEHEPMDHALRIMLLERARAMCETVSGALVAVTSREGIEAEARRVAAEILG